MNKPEIPKTCETPLATIDALHDAIRLSAALGDEHVPVRPIVLKRLLRDAQTLNELISKVRQ